MLALPPLEVRDEAADELGEARGLGKSETVLLLVRELEARDALPDGLIEELEPGSYEALHGAAVQAGEAGELVLVDEVEPGDHERQHLGVFRSHPAVARPAASRARR